MFLILWFLEKIETCSFSLLCCVDHHLVSLQLHAALTLARWHHRGLQRRTRRVQRGKNRVDLYKWNRFHKGNFHKWWVLHIIWRLPVPDKQAVHVWFSCGFVPSRWPKGAKAFSLPMHVWCVVRLVEFLLTQWSVTFDPTLLFNEMVKKSGDAGYGWIECFAAPQRRRSREKWDRASQQRRWGENGERCFGKHWVERRHPLRSPLQDQKEGSKEKGREGKEEVRRKNNSEVLVELGMVGFPTPKRPN